MKRLEHHYRVVERIRRQLTACCHQADKSDIARQQRLSDNCRSVAVATSRCVVDSVIRVTLELTSFHKVGYSDFQQVM